MCVLTSPLCCAAKCCGCIVLSQLIGLAISVGAVVLFVLLFQFYILPWGERQIVDKLGLPEGTDYSAIDAGVIAAQNCSGCVFGTNTDWPTTTTGTLHFLDTAAGTTLSSVVATSLVASVAAGAGSMLWASLFPSMASVLSFTSGFYEMTHILEQAQYIGMIGQLQIRGAPEFLYQFSKQLAWTNFNLPKSVTEKFLPARNRRLADITDAVQPKFNGETGPAKYASTLGVEPKNLFFYTLMIFGAVLVLIHVLYIVWIFVVTCISKKETFGEIAGKWYRKVVWACLLALLLAQYIFAMAGSYYIYENMRSDEPRDSNFIGGCLGLAAVVGFTVLFGIAIVANNTKELEDIGTLEHDQRPFASKYSAYYDEYNFDNRFFFVPRILLAIGTGIVVGTVQDPTKQLLIILGVTMVYLVLLILREPNLLRFLYYIGLASVFMKVILLCLMLVLVQDDFFPQNVRDKVAYAIIGINIFIFFLLFLRQAYLVVYKVVRGCKNKGNSSADDDDDIDRGRGGRDNVENGRANARYERLNSGADGQVGRTGALGGRPGANIAADPYAAQQQYKQQSYGGMSQQQEGYPRRDAGVPAPGAPSGPNARYGQQPTSPGSGYGQQGRAQRPGYGQNAQQPGSVQQAGYGNPAAVAANRQSGGPGQNRYGSGSSTGYGAASKVNAPNAGRSIADRYIGSTTEPNGAQSAQQSSSVSGGSSVAGARGVSGAGSVQGGANKPEPEKYTWRRNMDRTAEAAYTGAPEMPQEQRRSLLRFDSDDSYSTGTRTGDSDRGFMSSRGPGTEAAGLAAAAATGQTSSRSKGSAPSVDTDDMFVRRYPSEMETTRSNRSFLSQDTDSRERGRDGGRVMEFRDTDLESYSSRVNNDNSSFMTADSYASDRQRPVLVLQQSVGGTSSTDGSQRAFGRGDTQNLDHLADAYLRKDRVGAAAVENDVGGGEDDQIEVTKSLVQAPKSELGDDKEDLNSVDIDAVPDNDDSDDDEGSVDIDVDDDDRDSIDIDVDDGDSDFGDVDEDDDEGSIDIDMMTSGDLDSYRSIKKVDEIGLRDSTLSPPPRREQDPNMNQSFMSAVSTDSAEYVRQMSHESSRSDDDLSFYIDGRRQNATAEAQQAERANKYGPLKL